MLREKASRREHQQHPVTRNLGVDVCGRKQRIDPGIVPLIKKIGDMRVDKLRNGGQTFVVDPRRQVAEPVERIALRHLGGKAVDGLGQPFGRHRDGRIAREDDGDDPIRGRKLLIEVQRPAVGRIHGQEIQNVLVAAQREHPGQQERTQHRQQGEEPPPPP